MTQSPYRAPLRDMAFVMAGLDGAAALVRAGHSLLADSELAGEILAEAARFAERKLAPLYHDLDRHGVELIDGQVRVPGALRNVYEEFVAAGWPALAGPVEYGGQGLPQFIAMPVAEMWRSANLAFALAPMLTSAGVEALERHGSDDLKRRYLGRLVAGEWTGTMNLTEPQAGSDLALVQTVAERDGDAYRLKGRKIFITWGDHDLTENIVHFVLARTAGAPDGVRGLSLFVVPKRLVDRDGKPGEPNDIATVAIEHKLGLHGSPTCALTYGEHGGARAELVGELNAGLSAMFSMMSQARVAVGVEGIGIAERAYQKAVAFARERRQGRLPGREGPLPIVEHPDVRRMLMTMKASLLAMRCLAYRGALEVDLGRANPAAAARAGLLTPLIKAWCTETAQELVYLGLQVHGGVGYIEETGAAQLVRDARVTSIYEGTTGIQANDFTRRRLAGDGGDAGRALLAELRAALAADAVEAGLSKRSRERFSIALEAAGHVLDRVVAAESRTPAEAGAVAVPALMCFGIVLGGVELVRCVAAAVHGARQDARDETYLETTRWLAEFYADQILCRAQAYASAVEAGSQSTLQIPSERL